MKDNGEIYQEIIEVDDFNKSLAFKEAYLNNWDKLYIYAYRVLRDKKICEDIIQEIFLMLWKNKQKIGNIENLSAYLFQALRFQIFRHFRDKKVIALDIVKFNNILLTNNTEDLLDKRDRELEISSHVEKLPQRCKEIFCLSRTDNLTHNEIATKLDISTQTVKNQITKALKYLRLQIGEVTF
ncbi:MAG: sigma-70 family RNA polymerase sigma factor [Cellulophaga sp.]